MRSVYGALLLLAVQVAAFHWRILFQFERYQTPWDFQGYYYPLAEFFTKSLARGDWPLWEPYTYAGQPLFANINVQMFYPPWLALTALNLALGGTHAKYMLELNLALHALIAGFGVWRLLREMGAGFWSALAAGIVYQSGGFYASQPQYLGALCSAAWFPWAWLALMKLASGGPAGPWIAALAASLGMSILAGAPCVFIVMYVATFELALLLILTRQADWRLIRSTLAGMALGGLIAMVQILPTAELTRLSVASFRYEAVVAGGGVPPGVMWSLLIPNYWHVFEIGKIAWTHRWNPTFFYLFSGWTALVGLALATLAFPRRAIPFVAVGALSAFWMFGENTAAGKFIYLAIPAQLRNPLYAEYAMCGVALSLAVLAGMGLSQLDRWPKAAATAALIAGTELVLISANRPFNTTDVIDEAPIVAHDTFEFEKGLPAKVREITHVANPPYRAEAHDASNNWLWGAPVLEIPFAGGNDAFALRRYLAVRGLMADQAPGRFQRRVQPTRLDTRWPDFLNEAALVTTVEAPESLIGKDKWTLAGKYPPNHVIYRNATPLPRFFLTGRARPVADLDAALAAMRDPAFDPATEAVVEGAEVRSPQSRFDPVKVIRYTPDDIELEIRTDAPAYLVTSEVWYPGWRAEVNGRAVDITITNGAFRGLRVPIGPSRVRIYFSPMSLWLGLILSGAGVLIAVFISRGRRDGRGPEPAPSSSVQSPSAAPTS